MGEIKSALEIALEKTESVKGDKESLLAHDKRQDGKKIASKFLSEPDTTISYLKDSLQSYSKKEEKWVKEGILETIMSNLSLPTTKADLDRLPRLKEVLQLFIKDKKQVAYIIDQVKQFFNQYLENRDHIHQSLEEQFAPRMREKEQQLAQQLGTEVQLSPESDPEFAEYLRKHFGQLDEQYQQALDQVKGQIKGMFS